MSESLILLGTVLLLVGFILVIAGFGSKGEAKFGFGGFIGPIPFGFANDPKMLWVVMAISAGLILLFILPFIKQII